MLARLDCSLYFFLAFELEPTDPAGDGASGDTGLEILCDPCLESATASTRPSPKSLIGRSIS